MTRTEALRILGLPPDATPAEAKRAYRQLVKAVHPDKNSAPNARHLFQLVQEAYEFISAVGPPEQTWENTASDARNRSASEDWARTTREWAEREARQREEREREERERAEKEAKERAEREKRAREKQVEEELKEWERQRAAAATGIPGAIVCFLIPAAYMLLFMLILGSGKVFATIDKVFRIKLPAFVAVFWTAINGVFIILWVGFAVDKRVREYQLRKFDKNHPPPSRGKTVPNEAEAQKEWERQRAEAADLDLGGIVVFLVSFTTIIPTCCIVFYRLMRMIGLGGGAIFGVMIIAVPVIMFGAMWLVVTIIELIEKHQLRKFDENHPRPCKGTTERTTDDDA